MPPRLFAAGIIAVLTVACSERTPPSGAPTAAPPHVTPNAHATAPSPSPSPDPFAGARVLDGVRIDDLASRLQSAETAIRDPERVTDALREPARFQQATYRKLAETTDLVPQVIARLPASLRDPARANATAARDLLSLVRPRDDLPDWKIVEPPPAHELLTHYRAAQESTGVPWTYLAAIHLVETRMGRIRGRSTAGALGPMQFLPSTWQRWGSGDIESPADAISAAARYLAGHGAPSDMAQALFAYNHSAAYVRAVRAYAGVMEADPLAFRGYYHWQVYYRTARGDALLDVGYGT